MTQFIPFKEGQVHLLGDLNIENISDEEISIYGELNLLKTDKAESIKKINSLMNLLTAIKKELEC